jgi:sugar fermentation stimulation protein A
MLFSDKAIIKREVFYGKSRFDIYVEDGERKAFVEVKGVTLENGGVTSFPDAPTERGIKHLNELSAAINDGYEAYVLFIIQMKGVNLFEPNRERHPQFADALVNASNRGVKVLAVDCIVTENSIIADKNIDIKLQ